MTDYTRYITAGKAKIIAKLLPDTCQVFPAIGANPTVSAEGVHTTDTPVARFYNASQNIPCRIDPNRAFRPDNLMKQTTDLDEYTIQLPSDMTVVEGDYVIINSDRWEIRKLGGHSTWDMTVTALMMKAGRADEV